MDDNSGNIDQRLLKAYLNTTYEVLKPAYKIKIGEYHEDMDIFLFDNNSWTWAFVSASNPQSKTLSPDENAVRHQKLIDEVKKEGWRHCEALGVPNDITSWEAEKSLLILDIQENEAIELAKSFNQLAIVFGKFNGKAHLLWV